MDALIIVSFDIAWNASIAVGIRCAGFAGNRAEVAILTIGIQIESVWTGAVDCRFQECIR